MIGLGTLFNTFAIIAGGLLGMLIGNFFSEKYRLALTNVIGLAVIFFGLNDAITSAMEVPSSPTIMIIVSLVLGCLMGEWMDIEHHLEQFGEWLKKKSGSEGDTSFINGFVTASLTVCVGAMAIVGSIQDGVTGNYATLLLKAILDFLIIFVMSASLGKGCIFSAIPVFLLQGCVTFIAFFAKNFMTDLAILNLSLVGGLLITCVGVNLIRPKTFRVANLLPAILIAIIFAFV